MEVLARDLEEFLNRLVKTAGGDVLIVQQAIINIHKTSSDPSAEDLVKEILRLKRNASQTPPRRETVPA